MKKSLIIALALAMGSSHTFAGTSPISETYPQAVGQAAISQDEFYFKERMEQLFSAPIDFKAAKAASAFLYGEHTQAIRRMDGSHTQAVRQADSSHTQSVRQTPPGF